MLFNKDKTTLIIYPSGKQGATYTVPNSVTTINNTSFAYNFFITSVTIGNSVTSIGNYAFENCSSLAAVTIGNSVASIGDYAFRLCHSLTIVTNHAAIPQAIPFTVFYYVDITACTLHVPAGSLELYQAADVWKDFGIILADEISIKENSIAGINVYGNQNNVYIVNENNIPLRSVQIIDILGREIYRSENLTQTILPIYGANGVYVVRLVAQDGKTQAIKVMIND